MPQFYPDGPASVSLNAIEETGGLNTPPQEDFDTAAMQGSMQQLLSENLGKYVIADFLIGVSNIVRRVGVLYSVGRGFVVLYLDEYKAFEVCDIFSLKFVTFFPPGQEPTLEQLLSGAFGTGVLQPGGIGGVLQPGGIGGVLQSGGIGGVINQNQGQTAQGGMGISMAGQGGGYSSQSGCRTLRRK